MQLKRNFEPFINSGIISFVYTEENYKQIDMGISIYDRCKISILLSSGLNAVTSQSVINSGKNSILFFRPDELHFGRFTQSKRHSYLDIFIPFSFLNLSCCSKTSYFLTDSSDTRINYIIFNNAMQQKHISDIANSIIDLLHSDAAFVDVQLYSLMLQIILICNEHYLAQKSAPVCMPAPSIIDDTLSYITANYACKLSLDELASNAHCSVTHLSKLFKQHLGTTVYKYITAVRIRNAKLLLLNGSSVTEACFCSGFDDCSNFIRTFAKLTGQTPGQFKSDK